MEIHYTWEIKKFPLSLETLESPPFFGNLGELLRNTEWKLTLYSHGYEASIEGLEHSRVCDYLTLQLELLSEESHLGEIQVQCSILDVHNIKRFKVNITYEEEFMKERTLTLASRQNAFKLLHGSEFKIHCCLGKTLADYFCPVQALRTAPAIQSVHAGLWALYKEQTLVDLTLKVDDKEFKVHKVVLASQSKVFNAMFKHKLEEKNTDVVRITDVKPGVLKELIRFSYLGIVKNLDEVDSELLACADKYDLNELKKLCEASLMKNLTPTSATEILLLANLHGAKRLVDYTLNYITANIAECQMSLGWEQLVLQSPDSMQLIARFFTNYIVDIMEKNFCIDVKAGDS